MKLTDAAGIYTGNFLACARQWPSRSIDHVITDPAYLEHTHENQRRGAAKRKISKPRPVDFHHLTAEARGVYAAEIARLVRRWVIVLTDAEGWDGWKVDLEAAGLVYVRQLMWVRGTVDALSVDEAVPVMRGRKGAPQFTGDRPSAGHETMVLAHAPGVRMRWNGRGARTDGSGGRRGGGTVYFADIVTADRRLHRTQKPVGLLRELVRDYTAPGDLVFDPFAGSGTHVLAAVQEGRRGLGAEIDHAMAAKARARIEAAR